MPKLLLDPKHADTITAILQRLYPQAVVWVYGSRLQGNAHAGSDLDLVIQDYGQKEQDYLGLKKELEKSPVPFLIDIFEWDKLPPSFKVEIKKNHIGQW